MKVYSSYIGRVLQLRKESWQGEGSCIALLLSCQSFRRVRNIDDLNQNPKGFHAEQVRREGQFKNTDAKC